MKKQPIPFTIGTLLAGLLGSGVLTGVAFVVSFIALPDLPGIGFIALVTFSAGAGFGVGVRTWARFTQARKPVNPPAPNPDGKPESG